MAAARLLAAWSSFERVGDGSVFTSDARFTAKLHQEALLHHKADVPAAGFQWTTDLHRKAKLPAAAPPTPASGPTPVVSVLV